MWQCQECGAEFIQKNAAHSCIKTSLKAFLGQKSPKSRRLFKCLLKEFRKIGSIKLHPVKTRIAIMVDVRFCAVNRFGKDQIAGHLWLKEKIDSPKFYKIERIGNSDYIHHFRMEDETFIDREFRRYMKKAYRIGQRKYIPDSSSEI